MVQVHTFTEAGEGHENEDAFVVQEHPQDSTCLLCAIADGQGGRSGGKEAAVTACRIFLEQATQYSPSQLARPHFWHVLLHAADMGVLSDSSAGFTTLVALCVWNSQVAGGSSGDSAALLVQSPGSVSWLTSNQQKNPPVGSGSAVFSPIRAALKTPWQLLLMTDGVWKYAGQEALAELACRQTGEELMESAKALAKLPRTGAYQDDFTLIVLSTDG